MRTLFPISACKVFHGVAREGWDLGLGDCMKSEEGDGIGSIESFFALYLQFSGASSASIPVS